jgi:hypothetical protein
MFGPLLDVFNEAMVEVGGELLRWWVGTLK